MVNHDMNSEYAKREQSWEDLVARYRIVLILAFMALPICAVAGGLFALIVL
jgi:hypothetical protein